jgi:hypothetical protein
MSDSYEKRPRLAQKSKCRHVPCVCTVQQEGAYCSEYCEQAATQGIERDYCQCEHGCIAGRSSDEAAFAATGVTN